MKNLENKIIKDYLNKRKNKIDFKSTKESIKIGIQVTILISIIPVIITTKFLTSQNIDIKDIKSGINIIMGNEKNKISIFENRPLTDKEFTPK